MLPQEIIRRKRDGAALTEAEIAFFVRGIADFSLGEGQIAAFAMAVFLRGMTIGERVALTREMTASGRRLAWSLPGPVVDKHSTGGVGDKVSLMLAPIVAACGGFVPMISGRGLGHTGGTLDKMESIPGYRATPSIEEFQRVVAGAGCAIIGQTADLAPADGRLYAIRDVTATVETIPLITASILSKKLAAGLDGLVMDVKFGSGAFLPDEADAMELARSIAHVATGAGLPTVARLTDMNEVLGTTAGNAVETREAIRYLTGGARESRLHEVTMALAAEMLCLGRLAPDLDAAHEMAEAALASGRAAERFERMATMLGGPGDLLARTDHYLAAAPVVRPVTPERAGRIARIDVRAVGLAVIALGGGRRRAEDRIDPAVGFTEVAGLGAEVGPDRPLALVHARDAASAEIAAAQLRAAMALTEDGAPVAEYPVLGPRIAG